MFYPARAHPCQWFAPRRPGAPARPPAIGSGPCGAYHRFHERASRPQDPAAGGCCGGTVGPAPAGRRPPRRHGVQGGRRRAAGRQRGPLDVGRLRVRRRQDLHQPPAPRAEQHAGGFGRERGQPQSHVPGHGRRGDGPCTVAWILSCVAAGRRTRPVAGQAADSRRRGSAAGEVRPGLRRLQGARAAVDPAAFHPDLAGQPRPPARRGPNPPVVARRKNL